MFFSLGQVCQLVLANFKGSQVQKRGWFVRFILKASFASLGHPFLIALGYGHYTAMKLRCYYLSILRKDLVLTYLFDHLHLEWSIIYNPGG